MTTPTADPDGLPETLALAYGTIGRVRKHRILFLIGRARIHLDRVEGHGDFMELEVALPDGEQPDDAVLEADRLMAALGVTSDRLIPTAYLDLLHSQQ